MRKTIKVDLPERAAIAAALGLRIPPRFEADRHDATRALETARERYQTASAAIDTLRAKTALGLATFDALEAAVLTRTAAALAIDPAIAREKAALAALDAAVDAARAVVVREAGRWRDELQGTADALAVVLEELRVLEAELDRAVQAVTPGYGGMRSTACVAPLEWPMTLDDEGAARTLRITSVAR